MTRQTNAYSRCDAPSFRAEVSAAGSSVLGVTNTTDIEEIIRAARKRLVS